MGKYRKRFNEKARAGMLAKQAALKRVRNKQFNVTDATTNEDDDDANTNFFGETENPNSEILKPMTQEEKSKRKRKMEQQLYSENSKETKLSKAKKKRLDKYIEHQIKREEKKVLFEKLSKTKVDTSILSSSKLLGVGRQTRKEEMIEALELERQGRGDERTKEILYEEREVKEWPPEGIDTRMSYESDGDEDEDDDDKYGEFSQSQTTFIDHRPSKFGGTGSGFTFSNITKKEKKESKKKYSWRLRVEKEDKKKLHMEEEKDFESSEEEEDEEEDHDDEEQEEDEAEDDDAEDDSEEDSEEGEDEDSYEDDKDSIEDDEDSIEDDEDSIEDEDTDDSESDDDQPRLLKNKPKHSSLAESFKQWAESQIKVMEGRENTLMPELSEKVKKQYLKQTVRDEDIDHSSDEENYISIDKTLKRNAYYVDVSRSEQVQQQRIGLPVFGEEHRLMEGIYHHDCVVICGETGSGKTTQVPQFLYEAGFGGPNPEYPGMIGITQPRRVAAVSMASRVGNELGNHKHRVGYQIRFDTTVENEGKPNGTAIKFMTDGVLLREMMTDLLLKKYSVLIIDEAHERNINTDILIGMLSRVVKLRRQYYQKDPNTYKPLKLIIMSATLRVSDFTENKVLFKSPPPVLKVEARQYPVSIHFSRHTKYDYIEEAFKKTCKIHKRLPSGGILIFMTGQNEITTLVKKLRAEFPFATKKKNKSFAYGNGMDIKVKSNINIEPEAEEVDFSIGEQTSVNDNDNDVDDYDSDSGSESDGFEECLDPDQSEDDPLYVLPLYSLLPTKEQMKVFDEAPKGSRICIVATNVAETSLTIPGIRYVVDCGRLKERKYNEETGVQSFEIDWVSKASADQRAGRAGRTGPGHCYRLFSSAIYEQYFPQFSKPEILRMPFESVVLSMKSMGIDNVVNFPFPTPPARESLANAERLLVNLGAVDDKGLVTELGKSMAMFPLSPRFAKVLIIGNQFGCLPYIICLMSALSVGELFLNEVEIGIVHKTQVDDDEEYDHQNDERNKQLRSKFYQSKAMFSRLDKSSDAFQLLSAICAYDHVPENKRKSFVDDNFIRLKTLEEIIKLRRQLSYIVKIYTKKDSIAQDDEGDDGIKPLAVPSKKQIVAIKQMLAAGFIDQVAIRGDLVDSEVRLGNKMSIGAIPYKTVSTSVEFGDGVDPFVYIHPSSILVQQGQVPPSYLVYQTINRGSSKKNVDDEGGSAQPIKLKIKPLVDISGKALTNVGKNSSLVTYSKPLGHPYAPKNITPTKRECYVIPRFGASIGKGGVGWDLPVVKMIQVKKGGQWVNS
ncbi:putative ATP-dependent RNA helicase DHR1 [Scheffersomyces spartinae]|uniref:RNA helicase n=1 Tax=Scheffersomyces spartinae TaxID=45513 RepID=A0A9P8AH39_9ASCO|nr:putative ATP-dependent RNA helicase DHR1 [Scheffersomyces spartinae]KAG7191742.1 putative ATP-dependent RNA helicase DHR1 [Scheffersomyces spartinae]